jgi:hypothetical protein
MTDTLDSREQASNEAPPTSLTPAARADGAKHHRRRATA